MGRLKIYCTSDNLCQAEGHLVMGVLLFFTCGILLPLSSDSDSLEETEAVSTYSSLWPVWKRFNFSQLPKNL